MKIAQFKSPSGSAWILTEKETTHAYSEYVRMSEWVEVEFAPLPPEETVPAELGIIAKAEVELRNRFQVALDDLLVRRANLLALTHQPADV